MENTLSPTSTVFEVPLEGSGEARIAAWVFAPPYVSEVFPSPWVLAIPGGSYRGLAYYDRQIPGYVETAFSMARYLALEGIGVVVVDNPGTGASHAPVEGNAITRYVCAEVYRQLAAQMRERLTDGTLLPNMPPVSASNLWLAGMGHSMGGYLLTQVQGQYAPFEAAILLGWTNIARGDLLNIPATDMQTLFSTQDGMVYFRSIMRPFFYSSCVPQALIDIDEADATVIPAGLVDVVHTGIVADMAAQIRTPVYLGFGEVDMSSAPCAEPAAYPLASSISLFVLPEASHCANFSVNRFTLWEDIAVWCQLRAMQSTAGDTSLDHLLHVGASETAGSTSLYTTEPLVECEEC